MLADVGRPVRNSLLQRLQIARIKRSTGFFKTGKIASHGPHELPRRMERSPFGFLFGICLTGLFDQFPERGRGSAWLKLQPLPVTGQKRYLA